MDFVRKALVRLLKHDDGKLLNVTRILVRFLGIWSEEGSILVMRIACTLSLSACMIVGIFSSLYPTDEDIINYGVAMALSVFGFLGIIKNFWCYYNSKKIGWLIKELERITSENISQEESYRKKCIKAANIIKLLTMMPFVLISTVLGIESLYCLLLSSNGSRIMFNLHSFIDPTRYYSLALALQYFYWTWTVPNFIITFNLLVCFTMLSVANLSVLEGHLRSAAPLNLSHSVSLHTDIISFVKVMNKVLRPVIICELTLGSILTCFGAYMCIESITLQEKCISYIALCTVFLIPWFICHCGTILEDKFIQMTYSFFALLISLKSN